ncbi:MAG: LysR family transcriptional regulator [Actinomycetota bacterium]|nr:LysR family transcriptional regulator [Actinomycetota bacterium]
MEHSFPEGDFHVRGRFWISGPDETFLGYGRVVLLERIKEYGSITKAAKSMSMSYRHAWELIESMNLQHGKPLVISAVGGRGGGGARLTTEGERAIIIFRQLHDRFKDFLKDLESELASLKKQRIRTGGPR